VADNDHVDVHLLFTERNVSMLCDDVVARLESRGRQADFTP